MEGSGEEFHFAGGEFEVAGLSANEELPAVARGLRRQSGGERESRVKAFLDFDHRWRRGGRHVESGISNTQTR